MANANSLSGNDTLILNNRVFTDFADQDFAALTFPNEVSAVKTGKNNNSIFAQNTTGKNAELSVRLIRGSSDDKFLNNLFAQQQANFPGFVLMQGQFIKNIGDGKGAISGDTYVLGGGVFGKEPEAKGNAEGDTEQSVVIWMFKFASAARVIS